MTTIKRFSLYVLIGLMGLSLIQPAYGVVILDTTYHEYGFKKAEALAKSVQFGALVRMIGDEWDGSGIFIGNYNNHGYVLTAAHLFPPKTHAKNYRYYIVSSHKRYYGVKEFIHPLWRDEDFDDRQGYDFTIVKLDKPVTEVDYQPWLYSGHNEYGKLLTFMGYGDRGTGKKGEDEDINTKGRPAAAEGLIESVEPPAHPVPKHGDGGNYLGVWLPKEDGTMADPLNKHGAKKPVSEWIGLLGSGDSGGPAWIYTSHGWAVAGINSNGTENAEYGETSWFARVSYQKDWIHSIVPTARFRD